MRYKARWPYHHQLQTLCHYIFLELSFAFFQCKAKNDNVHLFASIFFFVISFDFTDKQVVFISSFIWDPFCCNNVKSESTYFLIVLPWNIVLMPFLLYEVASFYIQNRPLIAGYLNGFKMHYKASCQIELI